MRLRAPAPPRLRHLLASSTVALVAATGLVLAGPSCSASAAHQSAKNDRRIIEHIVRPGDTPGALAVRYHAWTAEVISHNHLSSAAALRVGQKIEIPVVISAAKASKSTRTTSRGQRKSQERKSQNKQAQNKQARNNQARSKRAQGKKRTARTFKFGRLVPRAVNRAKVRKMVATTARKRGVDPHLALAVAWQESGWQMDQISSARAIGAMQVLPTTVDWMELYVDRGLNPYKLRGNTTTGVELLRVLGRSTNSQRKQIAAYYQGLGAVREHGLFGETRPYVRNVQAIKRRLERGQAPG